MHSRIIYGIVVATVGMMIGRGIVLAFGLDRWVAQMIQTVTSWPTAEAVGWLLAGAFGLLGVAIWEASSLSDRLKGLAERRPALGSLRYSVCVIRIESLPEQGTASAELRVQLNNTNDFLLSYNAMIDGEVNGRTLPEGLAQLSGVAYSEKPTILVYRFPSIPTQQANPADPTVSGWVSYDLSYFASPDGKRKRRTARRLRFSTYLPLQKTQREVDQDVVRPEEETTMRFEDQIEA
jgi:hypothetical protein